MAKQIPEEFRTAIWRYELMQPNGSVFVLSAPTDDPTTVKFISFTPTDLRDLRPVIFPSKFNAEIYRQFMMETHPDSDIKNCEIKLVMRLPNGEGYYMTQCTATCPKCGKLSQHGNPETRVFWCEDCEESFETGM